MAHSVRSRAVAIPAGRSSATGSVRRAAATWRCAASPAFTILTIPLAAHNYAPPANHCPIDASNYRCSVGLSDFHQCVALAKIDFPDVIGRNSAVARNRAHQIARLDAIASANGEEKPRHSASFPFVPVLGSCPRRRGRIFRCRAALSALALEDVQRGSSELGTVKLVEQRLQGYKLTRWNTLRQNIA